MRRTESYLLVHIATAMVRPGQKLGTWKSKHLGIICCLSRYMSRKLDGKQIGDDSDTSGGLIHCATKLDTGKWCLEQAR